MTIGSEDSPPPPPTRSTGWKIEINGRWYDVVEYEINENDRMGEIRIRFLKNQQDQEYRRPTFVDNVYDWQKINEFLQMEKRRQQYMQRGGRTRDEIRMNRDFSDEQKEEMK